MSESLNTQEFRSKVFDDVGDPNWTYQGELPCIVDFYADWCGPCKVLSPILDSVGQDFEGRLKVYKVDTMANQELAANIGVNSLPMVLYLRKNHAPVFENKASPKKEIVLRIRELFGLEN